MSDSDIRIQRDLLDRLRASDPGHGSINNPNALTNPITRLIEELAKSKERVAELERETKKQSEQARAKKSKADRECNRLKEENRTLRAKVNSARGQKLLADEILMTCQEVTQARIELQSHIRQLEAATIKGVSELEETFKGVQQAWGLTVTIPDHVKKHVSNKLAEHEIAIASLVDLAKQLETNRRTDRTTSLTATSQQSDISQYVAKAAERMTNLHIITADNTEKDKWPVS